MKTINQIPLQDLMAVIIDLYSYENFNWPEFDNKKQLISSFDNRTIKEIEKYYNN